VAHAAWRVRIIYSFRNGHAGGPAAAGNLMGDTMDFLQLARERYSVRKYTSQAVERQKLEAVLEAARIAPTACNLQPWRVHVVQSEDLLERYDELTPMRYGAPTVLVFTYDVAEDWKNPLEEGVHSGEQDASIAATHAMLEAQDLGLATLWCNYLPNAGVAELLDLPASERVVLALNVGYAAPEAHPSKLHAAGKSLGELADFR
jgi:nitroreductase